MTRRKPKIVVNTFFMLYNSLILFIYLIKTFKCAKLLVILWFTKFHLGKCNTLIHQLFFHVIFSLNDKVNYSKTNRLLKIKSWGFCNWDSAQSFHSKQSIFILTSSPFSQFPYFKLPTSNWRMSTFFPINDPKFGKVLYKSPWMNSFMYVPKNVIKNLPALAQISITAV